MGQRHRWKHAIVIGASSGIGAALVRRLAADGARVAALARRSEALSQLAEELNVGLETERVLAVEHDVRDRSSVPALFQETARRLGGLDLVVYAAGVMPPVARDEYSTDKDADCIEVNVLGAMAWLNPTAERFARLGCGTIIGIGSIAGDRGRSGHPGYNTSKAALHTYLEALYNRIRRTGARVTTIKPGFIDTAMTRGVPGLFWVISPKRAAEIILRAAARGRRIAYVPARWRLVSLVIRSIPAVLFRYLKV